MECDQSYHTIHHTNYLDDLQEKKEEASDYFMLDTTLTQNVNSSPVTDWKKPKIVP
jgi:hypothetical protein